METGDPLLFYVDKSKLDDDDSNDDIETAAQTQKEKKIGMRDWHRSKEKHNKKGRNIIPVNKYTPPMNRNQ